MVGLHLNNNDLGYFLSPPKQQGTRQSSLLQFSGIFLQQKTTDYSNCDVLESGRWSREELLALAFFWNSQKFNLHFNEFTFEKLCHILISFFLFFFKKVISRFSLPSSLWFIVGMASRITRQWDVLFLHLAEIGCGWLVGRCLLCPITLRWFFYFFCLIEHNHLFNLPFQFCEDLCTDLPIGRNIRYICFSTVTLHFVYTVHGWNS